MKHSESFQARYRALPSDELYGALGSLANLDFKQEGRKRFRYSEGDEVRVLCQVFHSQLKAWKEQYTSKADLLNNSSLSYTVLLLLYHYLEKNIILLLITALADSFCLLGGVRVCVHARASVCACLHTCASV